MKVQVGSEVLFIVISKVVSLAFLFVLVLYFDNQSSGNYTYNPIGSLGADASEEIATIAWTDAHKVKSITRNSSSTKPDINYDYDEFGRRITKTVYGKSSPGVIDASNVYTTHYVLDADGNTMALYTEHTVPLVGTSFSCTAHDVYGSTRLGVVNEEIDMLTVPTNTNDLEVDFGNKDYELTNHLGNVITTISDRKKSIDGVYTYTGNANGNYTFDGSSFTNVTSGTGYYVQTNAPDGTTDYYIPDIHSVTDYYAFGQPMPGRNTTVGNSYLYGYNDKERNDEIKGDQNSYDYGARMYDDRLGRWMSRDRYQGNYPFTSPYNFSANSPISCKDPDGNKVIFVNGYYNGRSWLKWLFGDQGGKGYWGIRFLKAALGYFNDYNDYYVDGRGAFGVASTADERVDEGYFYAKENFEDLVGDIRDDKGGYKETVKIVSHSQGSAYAEGMIKYLEEQGVPVEKVIHLSPYEAGDFVASEGPLTMELSIKGDPLTAGVSEVATPEIKGVDRSANVDLLNNKDFSNRVGELSGAHVYTKQDPKTWDYIKDLENAQITYHFSHTTFGTWREQQIDNLIFNTKFHNIKINNKNKKQEAGADKRVKRYKFEKTKHPPPKK